MTEKNELESSDIVIDRDFDVSDNGEITAYIEAWFDVDKKFGLRINDDEDAWLNMFGIYDPINDTLTVECEISRETSSEDFKYQPTENESKVIKNLIIEKIREVCGCSPVELYEKFYGTAHCEQTL